MVGVAVAQAAARAAAAAATAAAAAVGARRWPMWGRRLRAPCWAGSRARWARTPTRSGFGLGSGLGQTLTPLAFALALTQVVSHPDDVIKTRMQTHLRGSPGVAAG